MINIHFFINKSSIRKKNIKKQSWGILTVIFFKAGLLPAMSTLSRSTDHKTTDVKEFKNTHKKVSGYN